VDLTLFLNEGGVVTLFIRLKSDGVRTPARIEGQSWHGDRAPTRESETRMDQGIARSAARARGAKETYAARDDELGRLGADDPWQAYSEMHATMTRHISKLLRDEERSGGKPSREVTDRLREYRATTEALTAYRRTHGSMLEAREFFATLSDRVAELQKLGEPKPAVEIPADYEPGSGFVGNGG